MTEPTKKPQKKEEPDVEKAPMAAKDPDLHSRVIALEKAIQELDARIAKHERYHFGRTP